MEPLSRFATVAIVAGTTVRGALAITLAGLWSECVLGLLYWAATGGVLTALLAGGAWWFAGWRPQLPPRQHAALPAAALSARPQPIGRLPRAA